MAHATSFNVKARQLMQDITFTFTFDRTTKVRLWIAVRLAHLAGLVAGTKVAIESVPDPVPTDANGIPRALSSIKFHRGYRADAVGMARGWVITLDGAVQDNVVAYDIDGDRISRYVTDDAGMPRVNEDLHSLTIEHHRGLVAVYPKGSDDHIRAVLPKRRQPVAVGY